MRPASSPAFPLLILAAALAGVSFGSIFARLAVNLASLELHLPLARAASPQTPDSMVFDLDPGNPANILDCARVALILRDLLSRMGLTGYVKTSGQKGLHVFVPLNRRDATFEDTKTFSKAVAGITQKH